MARILLVDDEPVVLETLGVLLRSESHEVMEIQEGSRAYDMLWSGEQLDLLITDIRMSPVDGLQLIKVAKEFRPDMPVLVVSAYLDDATIRRVKELGADHYVRKPFTSQEVLEALKTVLSGSAAGDTSAETAPPQG